MAYVYGAVADLGERAYISYSVTTTSTSVTITAALGFQAYSRAINDWKSPSASLSGGFGSAFLFGVEQQVNVPQGSYYKMLTKTKTVSRTTAAQSFVITWKAGATSLNYTDSTATVTINIPALASWTVAYRLNGGSDGPANQTKYYGKSLTLSSAQPTRTGYDFVKWNTESDGSGTSYAPGATYTANASLALYAIWKINTYAVSYNVNGGSGAPASQTKTYGMALTLSSTRPTRTGYDFVRWDTKSDGTGSTYQPGGSYTANAAVTLYAVWQKKTYTVTYNANSGSGAPASQTKIYGTALTLSSTKPTRTGYNFKNWNTASNGSGTSYSSGASYTVNAAVTLYAIWTIKTYAVSYNANGGSGAPANQTKTHGTALTLSTSKPTRTNYVFKSWNTAADGTGSTYNPGGSYTGNAALALYAVWELYIPPKITNLIAYRTDSSGTLDDAGSYCRVAFNWIEGTGPEGDILPSAIKVGYRERGTTSAYTYTSVSDIRSGTVSVNIGGGNLLLNKQYDIIAALTPAGTGRPDVTKLTYVSVASFIIDVNADGTAVAFGQQAPDDMAGLIIRMEPYLALDIYAAASTVDGKLYAAIEALGWESEVIV